MLNGPSEHSAQLTSPKKTETPTHFAVPEKVSRKCWTPAQLLEVAFYKHGKLVAGYPWIYILACIILTCSCSLGLLQFRWENNIVRLWNPTNSETGRNFAWLWKNHPPDLRRHTLIIYAEDVLQPQLIQRMYKIRQKLYTAVSKENVTWSQACLKVPLIPSKYSDFLEDVEEDSDEDDDAFAGFDDFGEDFQFTKTDFSVDFYPEPYCQNYNSLEDICFEDSFIELFALHGQVNETQIMNLTKDQILDAINAKTTKSGIFSVNKDFTQLLGRIQYDSEGNIQGAQALKMNLYGKMNVSEAHLESIEKDSLFGDQLALEQIDEVTRSIEDEFIGILEAERTKLEAEDTHLDFIVAKSFPDAVNERITGDIPKVLGSFGLMFLYVGVALSKCRLDCVDNKALLSRAGLAAVLMALVTSYGLCSLMGFFISPLHNFIPFLMLGLGVDDMFVIVQAFDQLEPLKDKSEIPDKLAKTLANAGVAITVTSLTDLLAFAVGSSTTVPALNSFCFFCGVGILIVYLYQITFFCAWLVIDQRRILDQRNACLPCLKSNCNTPLTNSNSKSCLPSLDLVGKYAEMLAFKPVKIAVILVTSGLLVASIYGNFMLDEDFDPWLFLSPKSYVAQFKATHDYYYPDKGENVILFFNGDVTQENLLGMDRLLSSLTSEAESHIIQNVDSWYTEFVKYFTQNLGHSQGLFSANVSIAEIHSALAQFLFSPAGGRYQYLFTFEEPLTCGRSLPTVYLNMMELAHFHFNSSNEGIEAMNSVKHLMRTSGFNGRSFPFSPMYSIWEIDEIIRSELYRNVLLATLAISIATVCLLSNLVGSIFVILCVFLTLCNVSGIIYFWGLNIDTVTCTVLIVCIGLSVDFSVHVIHAFIHSEGSSRDERVKNALKAISCAVLNGGFSTLLAVILLTLSDVYVFVAFFKIFVLVVIFGLYNGLVVLPVVLSLIGPKNKHHTNANPDPVSDPHELVELNKD